MCKYCEEMDKWDEGAIIADDNDYTDSFCLSEFPKGVFRIQCYADHSSAINFCPMCGRKLKEADDGND